MGKVVTMPSFEMNSNFLARAESLTKVYQANKANSNEDTPQQNVASTKKPTLLSPAGRMQECQFRLAILVQDINLGFDILQFENQSQKAVSSIIYAIHP